MLKRETGPGSLRKRNDEIRLGKIIARGQCLVFAQQHHGAHARAVCCGKAVHRQGPGQNAVARLGLRPPQTPAHHALTHGRLVCARASLRAPSSPIVSFIPSSNPAHSVACAVAGFVLLQAQSQRTGAQYTSKYEFPYVYQGQQCDFVMTSVLGHLCQVEFTDRYVAPVFYAWFLCIDAVTPPSLSFTLLAQAHPSLLAAHHSSLASFSELFLPRAPCSHMKWHSCPPSDLLKMDTPIRKFVPDDKLKFQKSAL